jgi:hypothetical protein
MKRALVLAGLLSCGSTGSDRFAFEAQAAGATTASFTNANGWSVMLTQATFTIGPVYLAPQAGRDTDRYVGEVLDRVTIDALSPAPVPFPSAGTMTEDTVRSAEIWLWPPPGIAPETVSVKNASLEVAGEAIRGGEHVTFHERIVLDEEWATAAKPGEHSATPLSELRKVRGIPTAFVPHRGGHLEIRIDARDLFAGADFNDEAQVRNTAFAGLRATATYEVQWVEHR